MPSSTLLPERPTPAFPVEAAPAGVEGAPHSALAVSQAPVPGLRVQADACLKPLSAFQLELMLNCAQKSSSNSLFFFFFFACFSASPVALRVVSGYELCLQFTSLSLAPGLLGPAQRRPPLASPPSGLAAEQAHRAALLGSPRSDVCSWTRAATHQPEFIFVIVSRWHLVIGKGRELERKQSDRMDCAPFRHLHALRPALGTPPDLTWGCLAACHSPFF